jgi:hypothetical protein
LPARPPRARAEPRTINPANVRIRYMVTDVPGGRGVLRRQARVQVDMQSGAYFAALSRGGVHCC